MRSWLETSEAVTVTAYIAMTDMIMAHIVMAHIVMAHIVMAHIVMVVMAYEIFAGDTRGRHSHALARRMLGTYPIPTY